MTTQYDAVKRQAYAELIANDGAILIWQSALNTVDWEWLIDNGDAIFDADSDCYVHPTAVKVSNGAWEMPQ
jgi:hypothetical protein